MTLVSPLAVNLQEPEFCVTFLGQLTYLRSITVDKHRFIFLPASVNLRNGFPGVTTHQSQFSRRHFVARATLALAGATGLSRTQTRADDADLSDQHGNRARLLSDDASALQHRLELIDSARCEVLMSVYEAGDDTTALRILAGLRAAARRGVTVNLIVDGHGVNNLLPKPLMEHLITESVMIKEHMPDVRYKVEIGRQRMHDKLMIVDGQQLIIGGRNLRSDYYGMSCQSEEKIRWDRDALVTGPIVTAVRSYFLQRWSASTSGQPTLDRAEKRRTREAQELAYLNDMPRDRAIVRACQLLDKAWASPLPCASCDSELTPQCARCAHTFELACVRFLHDIPEHPKDCPNSIAQQLNNAISQAQQTLLITTPYLVMSHLLVDVLKTLRERGVEVCLLTNSLASNDRTITHAQYANERRRLLSYGIELWEMKGERMLHTKSMVIDGQRSMIGSYNFDMLSETRNSETALLIDDVPFAEALTTQVARDLMRSMAVEGPLLGFDASHNDVNDQTLHKLRRQRLISPWIKKYL